MEQELRRLYPAIPGIIQAHLTSTSSDDTWQQIRDTLPGYDGGLDKWHAEAMKACASSVYLDEMKTSDYRRFVAGLLGAY